MRSLLLPLLYVTPLVSLSAPFPLKVAPRQFPHGIGAPTTLSQPKAAGSTSLESTPAVQFGPHGVGGSSNANANINVNPLQSLEPSSFSAPQIGPHGQVFGQVVKPFARTDLVHVPNSGNGTLICHVGGTLTSLLITLSPTSLPSVNAFNATLTAAKAFTEDALASHIDQPLSVTSQDPLEFSIDNGVLVHARSVQGQQLTWGIFGAAMGGLQEYLEIGEEHVAKEIRWQVYDGRWGHVGDGDIVGGGEGEATA